MACRLSRHRERQGIEITRMPDKGGADGGKDVAHEGRSAACASSCVWMAGDTCSAANARIWWIAKTGHKLSMAGRPAARSWGGMISACCRPSRWNLHLLTIPWCAATSVGPTATGSGRRVPGVMCRPCRTRWPSGRLGAGPGAGEWGHPAGPSPWRAWSQRPPSPSGVPAVVASSSPGSSGRCPTPP